MFHDLSKVGGLLFEPTNALLFLVLFGAVIGMIKRAATFGRRLALGAAVALSLLGLLPVGDWLLSPLENRFPPFKPGGAPVAGIVVLGGSVSTGATSFGLHQEPNQAADRLFEAARLARLYPRARVLVSGGPEDPGTHASEANDVTGYLTALGVPAAHQLLEKRSKDTFENARFSAALVHPKPGQRWLLITSAVHMPRAVGTFQAAGFTVTAAPADWRETPAGHSIGWPSSGNLARVDLAFKEYAGLLAYRLRGRTTELFPGP